MYKAVGANIQKELDMRGMSQQNLADALGISKQVMNKIIKGSKAININEISMIARVLGVTSDELLRASEIREEHDYLSFMGAIRDPETLEKVNTIRTAIDEIKMLEELLDV